MPVPSASAEVAFHHWVEGFEPPPWKADKLPIVAASLQAAAESSLQSLDAASPTPLKCIVHLQGAFARGTSVYDSVAEFVVTAQQLTSGGWMTRSLTRKDRTRLAGGIEQQLEQGDGGASVLHSSIGLNDISFALQFPEGELRLSVIPDVAHVSTRASIAGPNPFLGQPGACDAARALKVLMRRRPTAFPAICDAHAEALVLLPLLGGAESAPQHTAGGLHLFLRVLRLLQQGMDVNDLKRRLRCHDPSAFDLQPFMLQGQLDSWCQHALELLSRCTNTQGLLSADSVEDWLLGGASVPPPAPPALQKAPSTSATPRSASHSHAQPRPSPFRSVACGWGFVSLGEEARILSSSVRQVGRHRQGYMVSCLVVLFCLTVLLVWVLCCDGNAGLM